MEWLNYHHLHYFWVVAKEGGVTRAAEKLDLAQPTLSTQVKLLEDNLGTKLFAKAGRGLALTDTGRIVFRYAEEIFGLGRELQDVVAGRATYRPGTYVVGVSNGLSPAIAQRLLLSAFSLVEPPRLLCREASFENLLDGLARQEIDLILAEAGLPPGCRVKAHAHALGSSGVAWFGSADLVRRHPEPFPRCLEGAPVLLPAQGGAFRQDVDAWLEKRDLRVRVLGEFDDAGLMNAIGQEGTGFFPGPAALTREIQRQHRVTRIGVAEGLSCDTFAISTERRAKHAVLLTIQKCAKRELSTAP